MKTGGEGLNIKGSTISHMAAVHPGGISYREPYRKKKKLKVCSTEWWNYRTNPNVRQNLSEITTQKKYG